MTCSTQQKTERVLEALDRRSTLRYWLVISELANTVLKHFVGLCLGVMGVVVALQIVVRFVLPALGLAGSAAWSEELARYLLIWCVFLGAAVASRSGDLIAMETLVCAWTRFGWMLKNVSYLITVAFLLFGAWLGWRWVQFGAQETSTVMDIPMSWVYLAMPVGFVITAINIVTRVVEDLVFQKLSAPAMTATEGEALCSSALN